MDPRSLRLPKVIGHRGAAQRAPENTLAGFRKAAELGVKCVEFDVRLSLEGEPVVFHDDTLGRVSDGMGRVGATPLGDLRGRDVGSHFGPEYKAERLPTLDDVLALLRELRLAFNLEMKAEPGRERVLAEVTAHLLERGWPREAPTPLVSSFETPALSAFARCAPHIPRAFLVGALPPDWLDQARKLDVAAVVVNHKPLSLDGVRAVKAAGYPLLAYTVNHVRRAEELFGWGVDCIISDIPDAILAIA